MLHSLCQEPRGAGYLPIDSHLQPQQAAPGIAGSGAGHSAERGVREQPGGPRRGGHRHEQRRGAH